ncbi:hypothetical protein SBA1_1040040 [Candidatus Sulfotelmatobacter kueseliae]|uniref:Uncharacterized protein n=1 Tax=Candidatus Sulfotelmatobacter kueseliae TaxID=2042962 RepID=A0A2U3JXW5_9BACT|nr:hypothetical protein SBA1_1040040 [Candidatus Sulfotelmatobacter kueseliae]
MKRQITGLHAADRWAADQVPDGIFLVRVQRARFCRQAQKPYYNREQVENFVQQLADWAERDRNALVCQLNSYLGQKEGAA